MDFVALSYTLASSSKHGKGRRRNLEISGDDAVVSIVPLKVEEYHRDPVFLMSTFKKRQPRYDPPGSQIDGFAKRLWRPSSLSSRSYSRSSMSSQW